MLYSQSPPLAEKEWLTAEETSSGRSARDPDARSDLRSGRRPLKAPYQLTYRRSCIRLRQAEGDFANDLVAFISPRVRIAALGYESQHGKQNIAHRRILPRLRMIIASFCDCTVNCFTMGTALGAAGRLRGGLGRQDLPESRPLAGFFHNNRLAISVSATVAKADVQKLNAQVGR